MAYIPTKWENSPSTNTPLNADNLNKLESGVKEIHDMAASGQLDGKTGAKGAKGDKGDPGVTPEELLSIFARLDALEAK